MNLRHLQKFAVCAAMALAASAWPGGPALAQDPPVLTMAQAVSMALEHNQDLGLAQGQVQSSEASLKQDHDDFLPSLSADGALSTLADRSDSTPGAGYQTFTGGVSAKVNLFKGFEDQASLEKSRSALEADKQTRDRTIQSVLYNVAAGYIQAYTDRESIRVAEKNLEENAQLLEQVQAFFQAGTKPVTDLYHQQAETASAQLALLKAQRNYTVSRLNLMKNIGAPASAEFDVASPDLNIPALGDDIDMTALAKAAMGKRADIAAQVESINASKAQIREASSGYWPDVNLFGETSSSYTSYREDGFPDQFGNDNITSRAGISVSIPIFDQNLTRNKVAQARISLKTAGLQLEQIKRRVEVELGQALADYRTAEKQVEVTQAQLVYAGRALESNMQRYEVGASTLTELTQARAAYVQAQYEKIQAEMNLQAQAVALSYYSGNLSRENFASEDGA